jgi:hypothetical protein
VNHKRYTLAEVDAATKIRPPGYRDTLMRAIVDRDGDWLTFDTEHPAFVELRERHKADAKVPVRRLRNVLLDARTLAPVAPDDAAVWGPKRWAELHTFARTATPETLAAFVRDFRRKIPCGECRGGLTAFCKANPPEQADDAFVWTWALHEAVNAKLRKPGVTLEAARARWAT